MTDKVHIRNGKIIAVCVMCLRDRINVYSRKYRWCSSVLAGRLQKNRNEKVRTLTTLTSDPTQREATDFAETMGKLFFYVQ